VNHICRPEQETKDEWPLSCTASLGRLLSLCGTGSDAGAPRRHKQDREILQKKKKKAAPPKAGAPEIEEGLALEIDIWRAELAEKVEEHEGARNKPAARRKGRPAPTEGKSGVTSGSRIHSSRRGRPTIRAGNGPRMKGAAAAIPNRGRLKAASAIWKRVADRGPGPGPCGDGHRGRATFRTGSRDRRLSRNRVRADETGTRWARPISGQDREPRVGGGGGGVVIGDPDKALVQVATAGPGAADRPGTGRDDMIRATSARTGTRWGSEGPKWWWTAGTWRQRIKSHPGAGSEKAPININAVCWRRC